MVEMPKVSVSNSSILTWTKDMAFFALQRLKNLNASHNRVLAREGLSFKLAYLYSKLIIFHYTHLNYSHVKQTA